MLLSLILLLQAILVIFISGILYGFSDFIMRGLNKLPANNAIAAMQYINATVYRSLFMVLFAILVATSIVTAVWSVLTQGWSDSLYVLLGSICYVFGMFMITGRGNVPLNESLRKFESTHSANAESAWRTYYAPWTRLNTVRCVFGVLAGINWIIAAYLSLT